MAKFTRRDFIKASAAAGIVAGAIAAPALVSPFGRSVVATGATARPPLPGAITALSSTFDLNGSRHTVAHEARTTLWEVISERIGLTGTVRSCNRATCGVCTVVIDGVPLYSCHLLAHEAAEKPILTVESLGGPDGALEPIQEIGIRNMAADCGYCTAGWLTVAKTFLQKNPNPTEQEIKDALAGHLCRCSAYAGIIKTVKDTASYMRGEATL